MFRQVTLRVPFWLSAALLWLPYSAASVIVFVGTSLKVCLCMRSASVPSHNNFGKWPPLVFSQGKSASCFTLVLYIGFFTFDNEDELNNDDDWHTPCIFSLAVRVCLLTLQSNVTFATTSTAELILAMRNRNLQRLHRRCQVAEKPSLSSK